jgi:hypothetical protein
MEESLSGGTANLLRMARDGTQRAVAFVAFSHGGSGVATATFPPDPSEGPLAAEEVEDVVRQLWLDPSLGSGKGLVRTIRLGGRGPAGSTKPVAVAAVPLGTDDQGHAWGIVGVADPEPKPFGVAEFELLSRIGQRLASYARAREEIRRQRAAAPAGSVEEAGAERSPEASPAASVPERPATRSAAAPGPVPPRPAEPMPAALWAPPPPPTDAALAAAVAAPAAAVQAAAEPVRPLASAPEPAPTVVWGPPHPSPGRARADELERPGAPAAPHGTAPAPDALAPTSAASLLGEGATEGVGSLAGLIGRTGRLLGASAAATGSLVAVALEIDGGAVSDAEIAGLAQALRAELRFDDPLARLGARGFLAVVAVVAGGASPEAVEQRLAAALRARLGGARPGLGVRSVHVAAGLAADRDADEIVRTVVGKLRAS